MHILGITNGTFGGNSEILLKAALTAAVEADPSITVSWIHAPSVSVPTNPKPLADAMDISLGAVQSMKAGSESHIHNVIDDRAAVLNAILDADALIFATPVYSHQPPGMLKALTDRIMGPYTDASMATIITEGKQQRKPEFATAKIDERLLKPRVVGFMAVAGSALSDQITMALPTLHQLVYPLHAKVVDQYVFRGYAPPGTVVTQDDGKAVARAKQLGQHIASQIGKKFDDAQYLGPGPEGCCPYCHLSKIDIFCTKANTIGCVTCGAEGHLEVGADAVIRPVWKPNSDVSCLTMAGKMKHVRDIMSLGPQQTPVNENAKAHLKKWRETSFPLHPLPSNSHGDKFVPNPRMHRSI